MEESWGFHRPEEVVDWAEKPKNQWEEVMPGEGGADMVDIEAWQREVFEALTEAQSMEEAREAFKKVKAAKEKAIINRWCDGVEERERQKRTGGALAELEQTLAPIMEGHRSRFTEEREREREMGAAQLEYAIEAGVESGLLSALGTPVNSLVSLPDLEEVEDSSSEGSSLWSTSGELEWVAIGE